MPAGFLPESFGSQFDTSLYGGRASFGFRLPGQLRLQVDIEGQQTGTYCTPCGDRSYTAYAFHGDWRIGRNIDVGFFGGLQDVSPTFHAPSSTNYFFGAEARYLAPGWMAGIQAGHFDVSSGPGTLTDAWFVEGRFKVQVGRFFQSPQLSQLAVGLNVGHASGSLSTTGLSATSTQFSVSLSQRLTNNITGFVGFHHYENWVETRGTVWEENIIKGGFKVRLSNDPLPAIEENTPLPRIFGVTATY